MREIKVKNVIYRIHPVYDRYAADIDGNVINIDRKVPMRGHKHRTGYLYCNVRRHDQKNQKSYQVHRFVYECFIGLIPGDLVIDHINDIKDDNPLCNLQIMTPQQNSLKAAKNHDYSFTKRVRIRRSVKATNVKTKEIFYFKSLYAVQKNLDINVGIISKCCQGINNYKSGISKKDGQRYRFEYTTKIKITKC